MDVMHCWVALAQQWISIQYLWVMRKWFFFTVCEPGDKQAAESILRDEVHSQRREREREREIRCGWKGGGGTQSRGQMGWGNISDVMKKVHSVVLCEAAEAELREGNKCNRGASWVLTGRQRHSGRRYMRLSSWEWVMLPWRMVIVGLFYCCIKTGGAQHQAKGKTRAEVWSLNAGQQTFQLVESSFLHMTLHRAKYISEQRERHLISLSCESWLQENFTHKSVIYAVLMIYLQWLNESWL